MYIHEAVKAALEIKGKITRPQEDPDMHIEITPTNTYDACLITVVQGEKKITGRCWNPKVNDLMADDWTVIRK